MGFWGSILAKCFGHRAARTQTQPPKWAKASSAERVQNLPGEDYTLQPYLPMTSNRKHSIFLQADGYGNDKVLVEAYLDKRLKKSIISQDKALETNAEVIELPRPVSLKDDQDRAYTCPFKIIVRWYIPGKETRTFEETFYVFTEHGDFDVAVRLRVDIEPLGRPATAGDDAHDLFTLANATLTQRMEYPNTIVPLNQGPDLLTTYTTEEKKKQNTHEKKESAKTEQKKKDRKVELWEKYNGSGDAGNAGQGINSVSRH